MGASSNWSFKTSGSSGCFSLSLSLMASFMNWSMHLQLKVLPLTFERRSSLTVPHSSFWFMEVAWVNWVVSSDLLLMFVFVEVAWRRASMSLGWTISFGFATLSTFSKSVTEYSCFSCAQ